MTIGEVPRILVVAGHYLPGYKAGGPIRTLANLVETLGSEFRFAVLTSDRDIGEQQPYAGVSSGAWNRVGKADVYYCRPEQLGLRAWAALVRGCEYDLLYLNSFFSPFTIKTLLLRRLHLVPDKPIVLAPRGEFSPGAVEIKWAKKRMYMILAKALRLYESITWQASSEYEKAHLMAVLPRVVSGRPLSIRIGANLLVRKWADLHVSSDLTCGETAAHEFERLKLTGSLNVVFLSRISRKKNLDMALHMLLGIKGNLRFDIYGPIEDERYWGECQDLLVRLPSNVQAQYTGVLRPEQVVGALAQYHLLLFPTRGENFGHVIWEALAAGCLPLISDQTPWRNLAVRGAGWDLPLSEPYRFRIALEEAMALDQETFAYRSRMARALADEVRNSSSAVEANRHLFMKAVKSR